MIINRCCIKLVPLVTFILTLSSQHCIIGVLELMHADDSFETEQ